MQTPMKTMKKNENVPQVPKKKQRRRQPKVAQNEAGNLKSSQPRNSVAVAYSSIQRFPRKSKQTERFTSRDLVATISGSTAFSTTKFVVNPGLSSTFSWLAPNAVKWQQYRFSRLAFIYVTRSATTAKGSVILTPDYNPTDLPPADESHAFNNQNAVEDVPWKQEIICRLDVNAMFFSGPRKQIRSANISGDLNIYDAARLYVSTVGQADNSVIGNLYVDYDVELFVPQSSPLNGTSPISSSLYTSTISQTIITSTATPANFDNVLYDPLGFGSPVNGVVTPPSGNYLLQGFVCVMDTNAEAFGAFVQIYKNGGAVNSIVSYYSGTGAANQAVTLPINEIITMNGTDTCYVDVYLVGAAGTLTIPASKCSLVVRLT